MLGRTYDDQVCSIARSLEVLGERWTLLIVRDVLLGLRRFDDFQRSLGVARNVLTDRLSRLVEAGVLERLPYQERPLRHEYQLTPMGRELAVPVIGLMHWGDRHLAGPDGPPRLTRHRDCGGTLQAALICTACGQPVAGADMEVLPGPGLNPRHHTMATMDDRPPA
jgi:DNA-binding HxlR family transcriptional regulator